MPLELRLTGIVRPTQLTASIERRELRFGVLGQTLEFQLRLLDAGAYRARSVQLLNFGLFVSDDLLFLGLKCTQLSGGGLAQSRFGDQPLDVDHSRRRVGKSGSLERQGQQNVENHGA